MISNGNQKLSKIISDLHPHLADVLIQLILNLFHF